MLYATVFKFGEVVHIPITRRNYFHILHYDHALQSVVFPILREFACHCHWFNYLNIHVVKCIIVFLNVQKTAVS